MTMDYNVSHDTTNPISFQLNRYMHPQTYFTSNDYQIGEYYKSFSESFGGKATEFKNISITNGKYLFNIKLIILHHWK